MLNFTLGITTPCSPEFSAIFDCHVLSLRFVLVIHEERNVCDNSLQSFDRFKSPKIRKFSMEQNTFVFDMFIHFRTTYISIVPNYQKSENSVCNKIRSSSICLFTLELHTFRLFQIIKNPKIQYATKYVRLRYVYSL